jgi:hypothetical protein
MRLATTSVLASIAALSALAMAPYANAQSITNATQLRVDLAANSISGIKQGGSAAISGNGLTNALVAPTLSSAGEFAAADSSATGVNTAFSYAVSGYSADTAAAATTINSSAAALPTTTFGVQSGRFTDEVTGGAIAISATGVATASQATTVGATVTSLASTSLDNGFASTSFQRAGTATNAQSSFSAERQASSASMSGSGVTVAVGDLSSLADAALGAAAVVTDGTATLPTTGDAFSLNKTVVAGQASAALTASNTSVTQAGYGISSNTFGGTTAGALSGFTVNSLAVDTTGAAAGTSASLTAVSSFSVFSK